MRRLLTALAVAATLALPLGSVAARGGGEVRAGDPAPTGRGWCVIVQGPSGPMQVCTGRR
jgi:hypothetical protein